MANFSEIRPSHNFPYTLKIKIFMTIAFIFLFLLIYKLFIIQVVKYKIYQDLAINNKEQKIHIPAFRGEIFINSGKTRIVYNRKSYAIFLIPINFPKRGIEREELIRTISTNFDISVKTIIDSLKKGRWNPYESLVLKTDVPFEKINYLAENLEQFPGLYFGNIPMRVYKFGDIYSHLTGYIGLISRRQLTNLQNEFTTKGTRKYRKDSYVGKMGLEAYYDRELRGEDGYKIQIVDARNRVKNEENPLEGKPVPGHNIHLSIDSRIQWIVYDMMQKYNGACIVSRPATGEIVALYSYPSYDPNIFIGKVDYDSFKKYADNKNLPFLNRAIHAVYPPSSVFKIIVGLAALEDGNISSYVNYHSCKGEIYLGNQTFKCEGYHGPQNLINGLANSCNVYFYLTGLNIGSDPIFYYAREFHFGQKTGIDLTGEKSGILPSRRWKSEIKGDVWWDGDTANLSIGQGYLSATPAQMNLIISAVANNGIAYKPTILKKIVSAETGEVLFEQQPQEYIRLSISEKNIKKIQYALRQVVLNGTAKYGAYSPDLRIAGKTGTAQNIDGKPHAWFCCYAPYNYKKPEDVLAVTVFVEHGKSGGAAAAPLATAICRAIFLYENQRYAYKKIMQRWTSRESYYDQWLNKRNEEILEEEPEEETLE